MVLVFIIIRIEGEGLHLHVELFNNKKPMTIIYKKMFAEEFVNYD